MNCEIHICDLCDFKSMNKRNFLVHCNSKKHKDNELKSLKCMTCKKIYKNERSYKTHKKEFHINNLNKKYNKNINEINTNTNINNNIIKVSNKIDKFGDKIEQVGNKMERVENSVNKALTKASSLIKYLMEHFSHVPSLEKINEKECIDKLRIDYDCIDEDIEYKYELELVMIDDHYRNKFVKNISRTILNLVNHRHPGSQPIYNTDANRYNYVIKIKTKWNEDMSGVKFTDFIIKPILKAIEKLIHSYRVNRLECVNMYKNNLEQNIDHLDLMSRTLNFELSLTNDYLIKPILKELAPHLRFIEYEFDDYERYENFEPDFNYDDGFIKIKKRLI